MAPAHTGAALQLSVHGVRPVMLFGGSSKAAPKKPVKKAVKKPIKKAVVRLARRTLDAHTISPVC